MLTKTKITYSFIPDMIEIYEILTGKLYSAVAFKLCYIEGN